MKKILIFVIIIAVLAGAGFAAFKFLKPQQVQVEDVLPADPIAFIQLSDITKNIEYISQTEAWSTLSSIDYKSLFRNQDNPRAFFLLETVLNNITSVVEEYPVRQFFGQEVAFGIYPADIGSLESLALSGPQAIISKLLSSVFIVTRVDKEAQAAEFASRFFGSFGDINVTTIEYEKQTIRVAAIPQAGIDLAYVRLDDLLVIGVGEESVRKSIDVFRKKALPLAKDERFNQMRPTFFESSSVRSYIVLNKIVEVLKEQALKYAGQYAAVSSADASAADPMEQIERVFGQLEGLSLWTGSATIGDLSKMKISVSIDKGLMDPAYADFYTCPSVENKTIDFVPQGTMAYFWTNCFYIDQIWQQYQQSTAGMPDAQAGNPFQALEQTLGLSFDKDIIPAIGTEFGGYLSDVKEWNGFPVPELLVFLKVKNRDVFDKILNTFTGQSVLSFQAENYNNVEIKHVPLPLGDLVSPSFAYVNDYLVVSVNRQILKSSIDALSKKSPSLEQDSDFESVNFGLTSKNRDVQFYKPGIIIQKLQSVIDWGLKFAQAKDEQREAYRSGSEMRMQQTQQKIDETLESIDKTKEEISSAEKTIEDYRLEGLDTAASENLVKSLQEKMSALETELADFNREKEEIEAIVAGFDDSGLDQKQKEEILDEFFYPILNALGSIKTVGGRTMYESDIISSEVFLRLK